MSIERARLLGGSRPRVGSDFHWPEGLWSTFVPRWPRRRGLYFGLASSGGPQLRRRRSEARLFVRLTEPASAHRSDPRLFVVGGSASGPPRACRARLPWSSGRKANGWRRARRGCRHVPRWTRSGCPSLVMQRDSVDGDLLDGGRATEDQTSRRPLVESAPLPSRGWSARTSGLDFANPCSSLPSE